MLRIVLLGAAAVLAYVLLGALDGESARADDGQGRDGVSGGLLAHVLDRTPAVRDATPRLAETPPQALPRAASGTEPPQRRAAPAPLLPPVPTGRSAAPDVTGAVDRVTAPLTGRTKTVTDRAAAIVAQVRPAGGSPRPLPADPAPDPAVPGAVSRVVGTVPAVVGTVPAVVEGAPAVVDVVPDLVSAIPTAIGLLPGGMPDLVGVIPGVIDTLPQVTAPLLPAAPLPTDASVVPPPAARAGIPSAPVTADVMTTAVVTPDEHHLASVPRHPPSAMTAAPAVAGIGPGSTPGHPPTDQPLVGAHQTGGGSGGSGHPHAVPAASAVAVGYRFLFARLPGRTIRAGSIPGVPALPG